MSSKSMSEVINSIKDAAASAATTAGAKDLVYLAKSVESLYGADTLVNLMEKAGSPATVKSVADNTTSVDLSVEEVGRAVVVIKQDTDNAVKMKKVYELDNVADATSFSVTVDGIVFSKNAVTGNTETTVNTALRDLINADATWTTNSKVRSVAASVESTTNNLIIESINSGVAGAFTASVSASGGSPAATITETAGTAVSAADRTFGASTIVVTVPKYGFSTVIQNKTAAQLMVRHAEDSNSAGIPVTASTSNATRMVEFIMCDGIESVTKVIDAGAISSPTTTKGDVEYHDGTSLNRLPLGTKGESLQVSATGVPEWKSTGSYPFDRKTREYGVPIVYATTSAGIAASDAGVDPADPRCRPLDKKYYSGMHNNFGCQNVASNDYSTMFWINQDDRTHIWGSVTSDSDANGDTNIYRQRTPSFYFDDGYPQGDPLYYHQRYNCTFVLMDSGEVWGVGDNSYGQLGLGHTSQQRLFRKISFPTGVKIKKLISSGRSAYQTMMALDTDGIVYTWGYNNVGQVGDGSTAQRNTPYKHVMYTNTVDIFCGGEDRPSMYMLRETGGTQQLFGFGYNGKGQLSIGSTTSTNSPQNITIPTGKTFKYMVMFAGNDYNANHAGTAHFLMTDGSLYASGYNGHGEIGDSTTTQRTTMVQVTGWDGTSPANSVIHLWASSSRYGSISASAEDGKYYAWGRNNYANLGIGTTTTTINQRTDTSVRYVVQCRRTGHAGNEDHGSFCLARDGGTAGYASGEMHVYTTGYNGQGQRAKNGATTAGTNWKGHTLVNSYNEKWHNDVVEICSSGWSSAHQYYVRLSNNEMWGWGYNGRYNNGAAGWDNTTNYLLPVIWSKN